METISSAQSDDLKYDDGKTRVWLSRVNKNEASVEKLKNGRWSLVRVYRPKASLRANPSKVWISFPEVSKEWKTIFYYNKKKGEAGFINNQKQLDKEIESGSEIWKSHLDLSFDDLVLGKKKSVLMYSPDMTFASFKSNPRKEEKISKAPSEIYICVSNEAGKEKFFGLISELPQYMYENLLDENSGWMASAYKGSNKQFREAKNDSRYHHASHSASKIMEEVTLGDFL